jgi:hypothetical protein
MCRLVSNHQSRSKQNDNANHEQRLMPLQVESVDDGEMLRVSLTEDGITAWCMVSSMHLVDEKLSQLQESIRRQAVEALNAGVMGTAA